MSKQIQLQHGVAIIDDEDHERVSQYKWHSVRNRKTSDVIYATTHISGKTVYMHRMVIGAQPGEEVDHKDRNGLNNSRANLRLVTASQNHLNQKIRNDNTSGHKGISWIPEREKFQVYINVNRKRVPLGRYKTIEEAIYVRDKAVKEHYGEYARDNTQVPSGTHVTVHRSIPKQFRRRLKNNTSGRTGVTQAKNSWKAFIGLDGKEKILGYFKTFEEAVAAREKAEREYFPQFFNQPQAA